MDRRFFDLFETLDNPESVRADLMIRAGNTKTIYDLYQLAAEATAYAERGGHGVDELVEVFTAKIAEIRASALLPRSEVMAEV